MKGVALTRATPFPVLEKLVAFLLDKWYSTLYYIVTEQ